MFVTCEGRSKICAPKVNQNIYMCTKCELEIVIVARVYDACSHKCAPIWNQKLNNVMTGSFVPKMRECAPMLNQKGGDVHQQRPLFRVTF